MLDEVAAFAADRRLRIEAVRTVSIGGHFAMTLRVSGAESSLEQADRELTILSERTGSMVRMEADLGDDTSSEASYALYLSAGTAADAADVSQTLRHAGNLMRVLRVNISHIGTSNEPGDPFDAEFRVSLPNDVPASKFRELLGQLFDDLGVGWELRADVDG